MSFDVKNKTVLVTGANRGIGKAILEGALERGAKKVYAAVRRLDSADALVQEHGDRVVPVHLDLEDPETITAAAKQARDVELVINNAGVLKTEDPLSPKAVDALKTEMNINVYGLIRVAQAFAGTLRQNGGGAFVQLNSVASLRTFADFATYAASKAASYSITQALREKLANQGTQVVSVHPGPIQTDMANDAGLGEHAEPPSLVADAIFESLAQGRFHAWPDSMAKELGAAFQSFADNVIESDMEESPA